ncbi:MAG: MG2 domain-containing protein [bacterium]
MDFFGFKIDIKYAFTLLIFWILVLVSVIILNEAPAGSISGIIISDETQKPLANATIIASGPTQKMVTTSTDGTFKISGLSTGIYQLKMSARGYSPRWVPDINVVEAADAKVTDTALYPQSPYFNIFTYNNVVSPKEDLNIELNGQAIDKVNFTIYEVNPKEYEVTQGLPDLSSPTGKKITAWSETIRETSENWFRKTIAIPVKKPGIYHLVCEAQTFKGENIKDQMVFTITDLGIISKQSPHEILVYAANFSTNKPEAFAKVRIYEDQKMVLEGLTDASGLFIRNFKCKKDTNYFIFCDDRPSYATLNTRVYDEAQNYKTYVYTEKPIYRPGQIVYFKGIIKSQAISGYRTMGRKQVKVEIKDSSSNTIYERDMALNQFGSFNGKIDLDEEPPLGDYSIVTTVDGKDFYANFKVEEYRKPEYKVELKPKKTFFIAGDDINIKVLSSYYFGSPLAHAQVTYTVYANNYDAYDSYYYYDSYGYGEYVSSGSTYTDDKGQAELLIKTAKASQDKQYYIEVEVTDPSRKPVTETVSMIVARGEFGIDINFDKYVYAPKDVVNIDISTILHSGHPIAENVKVVLEEESWKNDKYEYKKILEKDVITNKSGKGSTSFIVEKEGYYRVKAVAKDKRGNELEYYRYLWVYGDGYGGVSYKYETVEIVSDKQKYNKGERAKLLINSPSTNSYALITVEGPKIYRSQVIKLKGHSALYELPLIPDFCPNVYFKVAIINGKNALFGEKNLVVSPKEEFIKVFVKSDKAKYYPGETAVFTIKTIDSRGRGAPAEVSFGLVDESIYAIAPETTTPIENFFYGNRGNSVETRYSFPSEYYGGNDKFTDEVRKRFVDTAAWYPNIYTNYYGIAYVRVKMPDNLTTWRTTVRANTQRNQVGSTTHKIITRKDLIVRLETPRFFTQDDQLYLNAVIHNYTDIKQDIKTRIEAQGIDIEGETSKNISIDPQGSKRVEWKAKLTSSGIAKITVYARGQGKRAQDAMELTLPVLPHGMERYVYDRSQIKDDSSQEFMVELPSNVIKSTVNLRIMLSPTSASAILGALDYLVGYPYGCVEQTMSKLLPDLIVIQTMKELGIRNGKLEKELPKMIKKGFARLYEYQHSDGGWGWWEHDDTDPFMTAYAFYGLIETRNSGFPIRKQALERGAESLTSQISGNADKLSADNASELCYMLYSLSHYRNIDDKIVNAVYRERAMLNPYAKALFAMALQNSDYHGKAKALVSELGKSAVTDKYGCHWSAKTERYSWYDNSTETTSYVLKAYLSIDPQEKYIDGAYNWLISQRSGNRWSSTKDTAAAVYALSDYTKYTARKNPPNYRVIVSLNGNDLKSYHITRANMFEKEIEIKVPKDMLSIGKNNIIVKKEGVGKLNYAHSCSYFGLDKNISAADQGISINREYFKISSKSTGQEGAFTYVKEPLSGALQPGDQIEVRLSISAPYRTQYLLIEDPLPSGFEVVPDKDEDSYSWNYNYSHKDIRDEKVAFFISDLYGSRTELTYILRAEIPGIFNVMPSLAYAMYTPQIRGWSNSHSIIVNQ